MEDWTLINAKHFFAKLPIELRLKIWTYNLPGPRIIEIKCSTESPPWTPQLQEGHQRPTTCTFTSPIPINLHVCRESRLEALKRYRLLFRSPSQPGQITFDPTKDTLYFGARLGIKASKARFNKFLSLVRPEDLAHVRHIAINEALISYNNHSSRTNGAARLTFEQILRQAHQRFINLERLTFVSDDRNPVYSTDAVLVEPRVHNRILERRIREAISTVEGQRPQFRSPPWDIRGIANEPDRPRHTQKLLGYEGSRKSFFRQVQLPQWERELTSWDMPFTHNPIVS